MNAAPDGHLSAPLCVLAHQGKYTNILKPLKRNTVASEHCIAIDMTGYRCEDHPSCYVAVYPRCQCCVYPPVALLKRTIPSDTNLTVNTYMYWTLIIYCCCYVSNIVHMIAVCVLIMQALLNDPNMPNLLH